MNSMIGDNTQSIDYAAEEIARLQQDYPSLQNTVDELLGEAAKFEVVSDNDTKRAVVTLIKRIRDEAKRLSGLHDLEKIPYLRRGQAVDQFFFSAEDKLARRDKRANEGAADRLNRILTDYDNRLLAEEQERRRLAAAELARIEAARVAEARRLAAEAEEARLKAERARLAETRATKQEAAAAAEEAASSARVEAALAEAKAEEAYVETLARPADIMRTRGDDGTLATMGTEKFVEIVDRSKIDMNKLAPYLPLAAIETAARKYADSVGYSADASVQIEGMRFGKRNKSQVR
jgi:hypothetical protein